MVYIRVWLWLWLRVWLRYGYTGSGYYPEDDQPKNGAHCSAKGEKITLRYFTYFLPLLFTLWLRWRSCIKLWMKLIKTGMLSIPNRGGKKVSNRLFCKGDRLLVPVTEGRTPVEWPQEDHWRPGFKSYVFVQITEPEKLPGITDWRGFCVLYIF